MPKNILQDLVKTKNEKNLKKKRVEKSESSEMARLEKIREVINSSKPAPKGPSYIVWIVAVVSVVFLFFALSYFFSKARVDVTPKTQDVVLKENISAGKDTSGGDVPFNLTAISDQVMQNVTATGEKDVSQKATGSIILYNTFSTSPQNLDIDTRLSGSNGKIYKTLTKTTIPGMKGGKPGSVKVDIYASVAGDAYNSAPLDFQIIGFKGTAKYTKLYGRSDGAITGGFVGKGIVLSDTDKAQAIAEATQALQSKLLQKAISQVPNGFVLFKDATFFNLDSQDIPFTSTNGTIPITLKGTLYGFIFDEEKLTAKIAQDNIDKYDGSSVYVLNIKDLVFSLLSKDAPSFADVQNINFTLSGNTKIVWKVDESKLTNDLLGKSKNEFNQVLLQYSNVALATLKVSPFWRMSIPDKIKDIQVIVNYPK